MNELWRTHRFLLMTLDPVHIGTGGYRLGRVDNSIVREPGTHLPKIPGTSLSGAIRTYAAYRYESLRCAGQGNPKDRDGHCRDDRCPICYTFGYIRGEEGGYAGVVNIFDAHILLFPVHSMAGPVWVSTKSRLAEFGFGVNKGPSKEGACVMVGDWWKQNALNLGWIMLEAEKSAQVTEPHGNGFAQSEAWKTVKNRLVLVTDKVFSQVVNSNLEVRTSVAINPETGAAESGALFTYEAIPRATWLVMDVVEDDYRGQFDQCKGLEKLDNAKSPLDVVHAGLKLMEYLGVGGMGTRGFGRVRLMSDWNCTRSVSHEAARAATQS